MTTALEFRVAQTHEAGLVAGVLTLAAARLAERGQALWDASEVNTSAVEAQARSGMYHLALEGTQPVGVFRFQLEDPHFWPEAPEGSSAFVHKLAITPERQGQQIARALLEYARELARRQQRRYLRLDCEAGRPKLRAFYERFGFRHHSQKQMGSAVFDRFEIDLEPDRANVFGKTDESPMPGHGAAGRID